MPERGREGVGVWRLADPKITLASMASLFLGLSVAWSEGPLSVSYAALTILGIFFVEVAKNASGEVFDFDSGTDLAVAPEDRSPFSGGKRVLVDGLLTRGQTMAVAAVTYALGGLVGLWIVAQGQRSVLWLGLAGVALAYFYHAPPFKLSYRGLGELAVGVCYGPLIASGAYLVQRGSLSRDLLLLSLPLGLLVTAFLWINELPDARADRGAGKRTLVVQLGNRRARAAFVAIVGAAYLGLLLLPQAGLPRPTLLALAGLPWAVAAGHRVLTADSTARLVPAQGWTLLAFLLYALGAGSGLLLF